MDFTEVNVLVDGHNLALPHGTGIKTYGLTLLAALRRLGMPTELLASAHWHGDPLVARSRVHDVPIKYIEGISPMAEKLRHLFRRPKTTEHVPSQKELPFPVPDNIFPFGHGCSVRPFIYEHALAVQERYSFPTRFQTRKRYDLWHATSPLPLIPTAMRHITTVHDLIPLLQPHTCPADRAAFADYIRLAIRQSDVIATVSEHTKRDLLTYFHVPEEKVVVTHQPTLLENWQGTNHARENVLRELDLAPQGYVLFVGNIEPKKNVGRLLKAYLGLNCKLPLVIAGQKAWMWEDDLAVLSRPHMKERVRLLGYVDTDWIPYLYESAYCMVFPSLYEGFGLPVLEAMTMGCPVVCSDTSSLPEVGGDAAEYVNPLDVDSIARGIERLLTDRLHRDSLVQRGRERAKLFSMENYVPKVARLYEKAMA